VWTAGDWNAFFGFGTNILVNMLVLTGLLRFVLRMPDSLVFGRILPALGLMLCLSTFYYAFLAYRLARKTGRNDVCALPSGVSVPHMFIVTFVIMLPITLKTGDPMKGWSAGLVWVFFQSFILMIGGFIAPYIRRITPRAALLGTLAGVAVTFISMRPALEMYMTPQIGLICFAIILVSWFGGFKYPMGVPAGLVAIAAGMLIAWGSTLFGFGLGAIPSRISVFPCRFRPPVRCLTALNSLVSSWSPLFPSESTISWSAWTMLRVPKRPEILTRRRVC
jgi:adenine/guanine/hypoxanthine permease